MAIYKNNDDRYDLSTRRGQVARTNNRNEVSSDNRYTEETRRVLEKIGAIARATAEKLGWDEGLVFQDMVRDLQLLGNPALVEQLDPSNPIDMLTKQILEMQIGGLLGDDSALNEMRSSTLNALMHMDEEQAAEQLYRMFNRGQISGNNYQRVETRRNNNNLIEDKLVEVSEECVNETENLLKDLGWEIESKRKNLFNGYHFQVFTTKTDFTEENWEKFVENTLEDALEIINDKYSCNPTFSANLMNDGSITAGFDLYKMKVEDSETIKDDREYKKMDLSWLNDYTFKNFARRSTSLSEQQKKEFNFANSINKQVTILAENDKQFLASVHYKIWNPDKTSKVTKNIQIWFPKSIIKNFSPFSNSQVDGIKDDKNSDAAFTEKFGADNLARYKRLNQKLEGNNKDITWVIAHIENANDLNEMLNVTEFGEFEPIAENDKFIVFDITDLPMCQKLAKNTSWCITAPSAWETNARFGARYNFYINKITGEKYCVAMVRNLKEIVDQNDNELARLPEGVPAVGEEEIVSSVVAENTSNEDALLGSVLANIQLLSVDTLRNAYDDMFGEELDMLEDEEVKDFLTEQIPNVDTNELKTYIENHIDDFAVMPQEEADYNEDDMDEVEDEDDEEVIDDDEEYDLEEIEEIDEEKVETPSREELVELIKTKLQNNTLIKVDKVEEADEYTTIHLKFTEKAYDLMSTDTAEAFYGKSTNITVFEEETSREEYFEILAILLNDEENRIWIYKDNDFKENHLNEITDIYSDESIEEVINNQNAVYE